MEWESSNLDVNYLQNGCFRNNASPTPVPSARRRKVDKFKTLSVQSKSTSHLPNATNGDLNGFGYDKNRGGSPELPSPRTPDSWGSPESPFSDDGMNGHGNYLNYGSHTLPRPPPRNRHRSYCQGSSKETSLSEEAIKKRVAMLFSLSGRGE